MASVVKKYRHVPGFRGDGRPGRASLPRTRAMGLEAASSLSPTQLRTIAQIVLVGGILSLLGSLAVIVTFLTAPRLRQSFAFQLVFGLSLAEAGNALWPMFYMPSEGPACQAQAALLQFFSLASVLWSAAIARTMYAALHARSSKVGTPDPPNVRAHHAVVWSSAAFFVLIPWTGGVLGPAGAWCWIDAREPNAQAFRLCCFYLPLWCVVAYEVVVYYRVGARLAALTRLAEATEAVRADMRRERRARRRERAGAYVDADVEDTDASDAEDSGAEGAYPSGARASPSGDGEADARVLRRLLRRLGAYPLILIVAWTFPTVNRVWNWCHRGERGDVYPLYVLMAIGMSTQGLANVCAYGLTAAVRSHVAESLGVRARWARGNATEGVARVDEALEMGTRDSEGFGVGEDAGGGDDGERGLLGEENARAGIDRAHVPRA